VCCDLSPHGQPSLRTRRGCSHSARLGRTGCRGPPTAPAYRSRPRRAGRRVTAVSTPRPAWPAAPRTAPGPPPPGSRRAAPLTKPRPAGSPEPPRPSARPAPPG